MSIHPTAVIDTAAIIDPTADIGPFVVVEGPVRVGPRVRVYAHAFLTGDTIIEADVKIHPGAVVGHEPQDLAYDGAVSSCRIGEGTIIREYATIHRGTQPGSATVVGRRCYIMACAHVAHNCTLGDDVKLANCALLAGHVQVGDGAFISGGVVVHQFVRIGSLVMVAGNARVPMDVPPYFLCDPDGACGGINAVGLRRAGFSSAERLDVKNAHRTLYRSGRTFRDAVEALAATVATVAGRRILDFLRAPSRRGIAAGPSARGAASPSSPGDAE